MMVDPIVVISGARISVATVMVAAALVAAGALVVIGIIMVRASRERREAAARQSRSAEDLEARMAELARIQAETAGRITAFQKQAEQYRDAHDLASADLFSPDLAIAPATAVASQAET